MLLNLTLNFEEKSEANWPKNNVLYRKNNQYKQSNNTAIPSKLLPRRWVLGT